MATTKTTYIDENGVKQPGYTKSGGIYADYIKNLDNGGSSIYTVMLQKNAEDIQGQTDKLNRQYDGLNTQLYRDYMLRKKTLPQQLSAQGISGGLSETTNLGLEAAYQDGLNQNERARYDALADLGAKGSSAELSILKDYRAEAAERAKMMASIGDFSGYKALGYTDEQIAALKAAWDAAHAPRYYGRGTITLGGAAQNIYKKLDKYGDTQSDAIWKLADKFKESGSMSQAEHDYLHSIFGY